MSTQAGPFSAPEGSAPKTYKVTITTVIPMVNTDPIAWDVHALLDTVADHHWLEVETVEMTEVTS